MAGGKSCSSSSEEDNLPNFECVSQGSHSSDSDFDEDKIETKIVSKRKRNSSGVSKGKSRVLKRSRSSASADLEADSKESESSRLSAKECRARKKLRYQYLEELVAACEQVVMKMRSELEKVRIFSIISG